VLTVSLVAVSDGDLIGHVAFSPVTVDGAALGWFGLGPVSVRRDRREQGVGGALIQEGLRSLRSAGAAGCVVLGNPGYYRRFGFEPDPAIRLEGVPPEKFMRLSFDGSNARGVVAYHRAFSAS
jgi:putative acetyltransferase